jgi:succinate dehydrogenase / fumarate reductase membrane anchor subunit
MRTPLARVRGLGSAKSGTDHFVLQRLTAAANIPLAIAFVILLASLQGADHARMIATMSHPLVALLLLFFVASGTIHMRIGMQVIIEDYVHAEGTKIVLLMLNTFFAISIGVGCVFSILKMSFGM